MLTAWKSIFIVAVSAVLLELVSSPVRMRFTLIDKPFLDGLSTFYETIASVVLQRFVSAKPNQDLREWLEATVYDTANGELSRNLNFCTPRTGQWLVETEEFKRFSSTSDVGILWIQANISESSNVKSVIAAKLVHELPRGQFGAPVCYFFFNKIMPLNRSLRAMLLDWLAQLGDVHPPLAAQLRQTRSWNYWKYNHIEKVPTSTLWTLFSDAAASIGRIYIVIDALEDMDQSEIESCIVNLCVVAMRNPGTIKIIVTSHMNMDFESRFKCDTGLLKITLGKDRGDADIAAYTKKRLEGTKYRGLSKETKGGLVTQLVARAQGNFFYVQLIIDEIFQQGADFQSSRNMLPRSISAVYSDILGKGRKTSGTEIEIQKLMLQVVALFTEPVSLTVMSNIFNLVVFGEKVLYMPVRSLAAQRKITKIFGLLLEIREGMVYPIHSSFLRYLMDKNDARQINGGDFPVFTATEGHKALCDLCLTFLNLRRFKKAGQDLRPPSSGCIVEGPAKSTIERAKQWPFQQYALYNWGYHARMGEVDDVSLFGKMTAHLETEASTYTQLRGDGLEHYIYPDKFQPLHFAAAHGITNYVLFLLNSGAEIDKRDSNDKTPLMYAAENGYLETLKILHGRGADLNLMDKNEWTSLHFAAKNGHHVVVRELIKSGVLVNSDAKVPRKLGIGYPSQQWLAKTMSAPPLYTPLRLGIQYGHRAVVQEILPYLKPEDVIFRNPQGSKGKTALHYAASRDRFDIVSDILRAGLVDVDQPDRAGRTPLIRAIQEYGSASTVMVLLQHGANPTLYNPLHMCAGKDKFYYGPQTQQDVQEIAAHLLAAGARIDAKDQDGNTPIFLAARGDPQILQWFVNNSANVQTRNNAGETPLHHARKLENIEILLQAGANVDAVDSAGSTPLAAILSDKFSDSVRFYQAEILELFEKYGANIS